mgnify:CR=1 FL=1
MKKIKKPVFKKNQIIVTALAAMIAVAGYLNYAGTSFDSSMLTAGSDSVSESDDSDMTADISAEDIYAQTGLNITREICWHLKKRYWDFISAVIHWRNMKSSGNVGSAM